MTIGLKPLTSESKAKPLLLMMDTKRTTIKKKI